MHIYLIYSFLKYETDSLVLIKFRDCLHSVGNQKNDLNECTMLPYCK